MWQQGHPDIQYPYKAVFLKLFGPMTTEPIKTYPPSINPSMRKVAITDGSKLLDPTLPTMQLDGLFYYSIRDSRSPRLLNSKLQAHVDCAWFEAEITLMTSLGFIFAEGSSNVNLIFHNFKLFKCSSWSVSAIGWPRRMELFLLVFIYIYTKWVVGSSN